MIIAAFSFNPEFSAGNLLTAISILASAVGLWFKLNEEVSLMKKDIAQLRDTQKEHAENIKAILATQAAMSITNATLTAILNERKPHQ
jgi:hypothetical protein